jgi:hypothetical protein
VFYIQIISFLLRNGRRGQKGSEQRKEFPELFHIEIAVRYQVQTIDIDMMNYANLVIPVRVVIDFQNVAILKFIGRQHLKKRIAVFRVQKPLADVSIAKIYHLCAVDLLLFRRPFSVIIFNFIKFHLLSPLADALRRKIILFPSKRRQLT